jgi:hypothetical protein
VLQAAALPQVVVLVVALVQLAQQVQQARKVQQVHQVPLGLQAHKVTRL